MIDTIIGIDPGKTTGVAIKRMDAFNGTLTEVTSCALHRAFALLAPYDRATTLVVFEDARLREWYGTGEQALYRKFIGNMPMTQQERHAYKGLLLGAGSVKRDCTIWEDYLTDEGFLFVGQRPQAKKTKLQGDFFKRVTGYKARTNEHGRDAAMLIINLSKVWANGQARELLQQRNK